MIPPPITNIPPTATKPEMAFVTDIWSGDCQNVGDEERAKDYQR
jgi:hypothetical protein